MLIQGFQSVPKLKYHVQKCRTSQIPEGNIRLCDANKPMVMNVLRLDAATYREARQQFREICKDHHVYGKMASDECVWDLAKNELVNQNANIRKVLFAEGTDKEAADRAVILDVFCRHTAKCVRKLKGFAQGKEAAGTEIGFGVAQEEDGMMQMYGVMREESIADVLTGKEGHMMLMNGVTGAESIGNVGDGGDEKEGEQSMMEDMREDPADAANTLEILRMFVNQDLDIGK
jgi:hypothetical protein